MTIETLATFFGWCSVINVVLLTLTSVLIMAMRGAVSRIHGKIFGLDEKSLAQAYFQYLGQYKVAVIVLNIVPYFALKIMS